MDTISDPRATRAARPASGGSPDEAHLSLHRPWRRHLRTIARVRVSVLVVIAVGVLFVPAPYLLHHPGAVINATGALTGSAVTDPAFGDGGRFLLTTQRTTPLRWGGYLWFSAWSPPGATVVPLPPTVPRTQYRSLAAMDQSKDLAAAVAGCVVHRCEPEPVGVRVVGVTAGSPAARGGLRPEDVIVGATGLPVPRAYADDAAPVMTSVGDILRMLRFAETPAPTTQQRSVGLDVLRGGEVTPLRITSEGGPLGADLVTAWVAQRDMEVDTGNVGGPSTGLMLTLTLVDAMTAGDLTGGRSIAGTGTVAADGTIGPIGGVEAKVAGAVREGADVFLVPPINAGEALQAAPRSLEVVQVTTVESALRWLCGTGGASEACDPGRRPELQEPIEFRDLDQ